MLAMLAMGKAGEIKQAAAGATAFQELLSISFGGWIMGERLLAAQKEGDRLDAQSITTDFYNSHVLSKASALFGMISTAAVVNDLPEDLF